MPAALIPIGTAIAGSVASKALSDDGGGPQAAPTQSFVTPEQANAAYFNSKSAVGSQQRLLQALQAQNGIQNQSDVYNQLGQVAQGQGPNPALAQLNNATGANVANQAALMAGQRGAGANVGLIARQAAMQGANTQQQAAGQGAELQANQSLNALGMQGGIAGQQVGNQLAAQQGYTQAALGQQQNLLGAGNAANNAAVGSQNNVNSINSSNMQANQKIVGGAIGGAGAALADLAGSKPESSGGLGGTSLGSTPAQELYSGGEVGGGPQSHFAKFVHGGSNVAMQSGGEVPGRAVVSGNSPKNDMVPALVSPGEVVIPRNVMQSPNAPEAAARFVAAVLAKKGRK